MLTEVTRAARAGIGPRIMPRRAFALRARASRPLVAVGSFTRPEPNGRLPPPDTPIPLAGNPVTGTSGEQIEWITGLLRANGRRCPCARSSTPGNRPGGRPAAQTVRWSAGHNPNKSQVFPVKKPNGSRNPPARSFLPGGKICSALASSNRVPERTVDQQR